MRFSMLCLWKHKQQTNSKNEAAALGRNRSGFTTKLSLSLSDASVPLRFTFSPTSQNVTLITKIIFFKT